MNEMERRVKNLEERAEEKRGKRVTYIWTKPGEPEDVALERWRKENPGEDEGDLLVFLVSWASDSWILGKR